MLGAMPYAFSDGDLGIFKRSINSRAYGKVIGSTLNTLLPDGRYTFQKIANILSNASVFDFVFLSLRVQTTTTTNRFNRDGKKLLSSFSLKEIINILNSYGSNVDINDIDGADKDYYLYCLSIILLKKKNAAMVEKAYEVLEPITLRWEEGTHTWRCNLSCNLRYYYRFQGTLRIKEE